VFVGFLVDVTVRPADVGVDGKDQRVEVVSYEPVFEIDLAELLYSRECFGKSR
jgi:hypothetical protein